MPAPVPTRRTLHTLQRGVAALCAGGRTRRAGLQPSHAPRALPTCAWPLYNTSQLKNKCRSVCVEPPPMHRTPCTTHLF